MWINFYLRENWISEWKNDSSFWTEARGSFNDVSVVFVHRE